MRRAPLFLTFCLLFAGALAHGPSSPEASAAQGPGPPPPQAPAGQAPPAQGRGGGRATFPAQQRPLAEAATLSRGETLYGIHCRSCHGRDLRGGDLGGPNLLRSPIALNDQDGETIGPVIVNGRQSPGMPSMPPLKLIEDETKAIAAFIRSLLAAARPQGAPPAGPAVTLNVLVGDPVAGRRYFDQNCQSCHSTSGDLQNLAARFPDPMQLQNTWVAGGRGGGRGAAPAPVAGPPSRRDVTVTVTPSSGPSVEGRLDRIDDFLVVLRLADGTLRSFRRDGDVPIVAINDPLDAHKKLLLVYTDDDIHNVTAYLATLK
jgi:cytochrome c oxidase cbb3-type subunit 3